MIPIYLVDGRTTSLYLRQFKMVATFPKQINHLLDRFCSARPGCTASHVFTPPLKKKRKTIIITVEFYLGYTTLAWQSKSAVQLNLITVIPQLVIIRVTQAAQF